MTEPAPRFRRVFRYDDADQLVAVEDESGWRVEYDYDANGNRTRRTTTGTEGTGPAAEPPTPPAQS